MESGSNSNQVSVLDSSDLFRDRGRISEENASMPIQSSRTLLDIIREEESGTAYRDLIDSQTNDKKKNQKSLKDRLRLRRSGSSRSLSSVPSSDISIKNYKDLSPTSRSSRKSLQISRTMENSNEATVTSPDAAMVESMEDRGKEEGGNETGPLVSESVAEEAEKEEEEIRGTTLMALLEETDRQQGVVRPTFFETQEDEDEDEEEKGGEEEEEEGGEEHVCCVCMVGHRGAAFIPCGHTFCRLCSRELWVSRGNCPLCNAFIMEILHIF